MIDPEALTSPGCKLWAKTGVSPEKLDGRFELLPSARGEVLMSVYTLDGAPMAEDPRHALQRQVDLLAAKGLHPAGAFELE